MIVAIAAMTRDRVIGCGGGIPWKLKRDMQFFRRMTTGNMVVMGRKTYESLGRPLPDRENIVVSRSRDFSVPGVRVVDSPDAVDAPTDGRDLYVIGGAEIYRSMLPRCGAVVLTLVPGDYPGDTYFPEFESAFPVVEILEKDSELEIRRYLRPPDS